MKIPGDITGERFGKLTAVEYVGSTTHGRKWRCTCDCGGETVAHTHSLRGEQIRSCGCMGPKIQLKDQRFGKLLVLSEHPKRDKTGLIRWNCRCKCGGTVIVRGTDLRFGKVTSCGCDE